MIWNLDYRAGATRLHKRLRNSYTGREYYESYQILINKLKEYIINQQEFFIPQDKYVENKHITFITYDELSAMEIKDNFRRNSIDVRNLFNKVALDFIMTKGIYEGRDSEIAKLEALKNEITEGVEE